MPSNPLLPLLQATARVDLSFCELKSPQDWLDFIAENMGVDSAAVDFDNDIIFSPTEPTGDNFGKLWVKATGGGPANPRGIGIVVNGSYVLIPIPEDQEQPDSNIPPGGIIIWPNESVPDGWTLFPGTPDVGAIYISKD